MSRRTRPGRTCRFRDCSWTCCAKSLLCRGRPRRMRTRKPAPGRKPLKPRPSRRAGASTVSVSLVRRRQTRRRFPPGSKASRNPNIRRAFMARPMGLSPSTLWDRKKRSRRRIIRALVLSTSPCATMARSISSPGCSPPRFSYSPPIPWPRFGSRVACVSPRGARSPALFSLPLAPRCWSRRGSRPSPPPQACPRAILAPR